MGILENIDLYGIDCQMRVYGKETFGTWLGGVLTVVTIGITGLFAFLLGTDMWFKQNPQVVTSQFMPEKTGMIYPASNNFTIAYRTEDSSGNLIDSEQVGQLFTPILSYVYFKKNENKEWEEIFYSSFPNILCSETKASENKEIEYIDLSKLYCIDWELISKKGKQIRGKDFEPVLGGSWEEDEVAYFFFEVGNFILEGNELKEYKSRSKINELIKADYYYFSLFYPESYFDSTDFDKPLKSYLKNYYSRINTKINRIDRFFFQENIVKDDIGWLFEDKLTYNNFKKSRQEIEFDVHGEEAKYETYFNFFFYLDKAQTIFNRKFMKIQDLAALLGGFIKITQIIFRTVASIFAKYKRILFVTNKLKQNCKNSLSVSKKNSSSSMNNFVKLKPSCTLESPDISFFKYLLRNCFKTKTNHDAFIRAKTKIEDHQDIKTFLNLRKEVDELKKAFKEQHKA